MATKYDAYAPRVIPVGEFKGGLAYFTHSPVTVFDAIPDAVSGKRPQAELDGKKLWHITAQAQGKLVKIKVALAEEPLLKSGTLLAFENLECGVMNGNFWFRADDVSLAE